MFLKGLELQETSPGIWRIEPQGKMRVGVHLVGTPELLKALESDMSIQQAMNVATLPGVLDPVLTMPDIHQGYGFPIGGVAAFHAKTGIVSPGGVGYDINCGVRMLTSSLLREQLGERDKLRALVRDLFEAVPSGVGSQRKDLTYSQSDFEKILEEGAHWAIARGFALAEDIEHIEERGQMKNANPEKVSPRAKERGFHQLGTLGSGNHFLEVQFVDEIYDEKVAKAFGLFLDQVVVTIHTGSRGLGYQVCTDYLESSFKASQKYGIELVDRQLASAPLESEEGQSYLGAMSAAANFAFCNRQLITHWTREVFSRHYPNTKLSVLYDVCHNIAKWEEMPHGKTSMRVCVHRKGATRAYPPNHPLVPPDYRRVGQPVLVPGDMGRYSFILVGGKDSLEHTFGSACHGAGRELSRGQAKKLAKGRPLTRELEDKGIYVKTAGRHTLVEEMPEAYKDVANVVNATAHAGVANLVARLRPICVVKG
jgi:tRNA-splicing ligase RtcB (3'-phosphate/5'-hydroxy nucleic acid ligase)